MRSPVASFCLPTKMYAKDYRPLQRLSALSHLTSSSLALHDGSIDFSRCPEPMTKSVCYSALSAGRLRQSP